MPQPDAIGSCSAVAVAPVQALLEGNYQPVIAKQGQQELPLNVDIVRGAY